MPEADDLESVGRLFAQMAQHGTERLKAFLSGRAALEIFVAKTFKKYQEALFAPLSGVGQHSPRERFLDRVKGVMNDKYRLTDKFSAIAAVLFAGAEEAEMEADMKSFSDLKRLRDSILHGDEFAEKDLPVHALAALLRKYVLAHIAMPNNALQATREDARA